MPLRTDDCDLRDVSFNMSHGGNGDFYATLTEYPNDELPSGAKEFKQIHYRMSMSGGFATRYPEVKNAFVALYRAMEAAGLNEFPSGPSK
ncbi:MAG: hypothetical protein WCO35_03100 [Candidatus Nomurabacteria bacterium]